MAETTTEPINDERDKELKRLTRENMRLRKREQRLEARLQRSVSIVSKDKIDAQKLDLKQLTEQQIRHLIELGNPVVISAVYKLLHESSANTLDGLSEQDRRNIAYVRGLRAMSIDQLKARISERQTTLKSAGNGFYALPPTVRVVCKEDIGDISNATWFAEMRAHLISELDDNRADVVKLCREVLESAEKPNDPLAPIVVASSCSTIKDEPMGAPLPLPEKPHGLPVDYQAQLPKPEPVKSPVTAGAEGEKLKEQSGVVYHPPIPDIFL